MEIVKRITTRPRYILAKVIFVFTLIHFLFILKSCVYAKVSIFCLSRLFFFYLDTNLVMFLNK